MPIDTRDWYRPKEFRDAPRYAPGGHEDSLSWNRGRRKPKLLPFLLVSIGLAVICDLFLGDRVLSSFEETRKHIAVYLEKYGHAPLIGARNAVHQQECHEQSAIPVNGAQAWFDDRKPMASELSGRFQLHNNSHRYLVASFTDLGKKTASVVVYPKQKTEIRLPIVGEWQVEFVFGSSFCRDPNFPLKDGKEVKVVGQFVLSPERMYVISANES